MIRRSLAKPALTLAILTCTAVGLSACAGANESGGGGGGSSVLTIQGDAGDPTLTENFNPFSTTELEGTRLIYEPLEIPSSVNGKLMPFLATSSSTPDPTTLTFSLRSGVTWS